MIRAVPIHDYRCDACGHAFSAVQSYTDATLEVCPRCGARPRKLMASPALVFKGSGFYKTDSRRGSADARADAKADGKGDGTSDAASGGKGDATDPKPATPAAATEKPAKAKAEAKAEAKKEPAS